MRMPRRAWALLAGSLGLATVLAGWVGWSLAAAPKAYLFTGVVTAVDAKDRTITVDKGGDAWEFGVEDWKSLKARKGDRVTVHYTMTARRIEPQK
jgi:hypothetical protein